jgi:hypothetical protein
MRRLLKTLVLQDIEQQVLMLLHQGQEGFAAGGGPAGEKGADSLLPDEPFGLPGGHRPIRAAIRDQHLHGSI